MRQTQLKPGRDGQYTRNIGYKLTRSGKRSQPKFYLGSDRKAAERRLAKIVELWEHIEKGSDEPVWGDFELRVAKGMARGELQVPVKPNLHDNGHVYLVHLNLMSARYPMVNFVPTDRKLAQEGTAFNRLAVDHQMKVMRDRGILTDHEPQEFSDGTLHQAMGRYIAWIEREYLDSSEGHVSDNGITKIRLVKIVMERVPEAPLSAVGYSTADAIIGMFRKRPLGKRTEKPMAKKTCQNCIGEIRRFFDWLDLADEFQWHLPERYHRIKRKVDRLESDIEKDNEDIPTYAIDELCLLNEYATPIERLFLLLGLNCAFGADQSGRLRIGEVRFSEAETEHSFIQRIRLKQLVKGRHLLWEQTVEGLRWALVHRQALGLSLDKDCFLVVKSTGTPYWRKTKGGNRCRDIPNLWNRLIDRIQADFPDFSRHAFNTLRDTSIDMMRRIAGEEVSSIHATHKHQSLDKNLRNYSNPLWERLFETHLRLESKLKPVFDAAPEEAFEPQPQAYISRRTVQRIIELRKDGWAIQRIAKELGLSRATVGRKLKTES